VYDENIQAEWHHLRPLCVFGSVESDDNYVRLRPVLHVKVHAALCYFFPSYYPLQNSLNFTVDGNSNRTSEDVSAVALLKDEGKLAEIGLAREKAAIHQREFMKGTTYALKPTSSDPKVQQEDGAYLLIGLYWLSNSKFESFCAPAFTIYRASQPE
jgi:hypothetical protein